MSSSKSAIKVQISLSDFIEFVSKVGSNKYTKVREIKKRDPYHPAFDFWKPLRDRIIEIHQDDLSKSHLDKILLSLSDQKKLKLYPNIIDQYKSFLGKKELRWIAPPSREWNAENLFIKINPELGLYINDKLYIVKLYFKSEPLSKAKVELILLMMNEVLKTGNFKEATFAILDVPRKKLYEPTPTKKTHISLLEGEALSFLKMWESI